MPELARNGDVSAGSATARIRELASAHVAARCLHVIASAGIADFVSDTPRSARDVAAQVNVDAVALQRILCLLETYGLFQFRRTGWVHTPASALLKTDNPMSMRAFAAMMGDPVNFESLEALAHALRTGIADASKMRPKG